MKINSDWRNVAMPRERKRCKQLLDRLSWHLQEHTRCLASGLTTVDIGRLLGIDRASAFSRTHRARDLLSCRNPCEMCRVLFLAEGARRPDLFSLIPEDSQEGIPEWQKISLPRERAIFEERFHALKDFQVETARAVAFGLTIKDIAEILRRQQRTIEDRYTTIVKKMGVRNGCHLARALFLIEGCRRPNLLGVFVPEDPDQTEE